MLSLSFFTEKPQTSQASTFSVIKEIASWVLGDGLMKHCCLKWDKIGADQFEDVSLTDEIAGIFSNNKKTLICSANSIVKNASRVIGSYLMGPLGYAAGNLTGNALQCLLAWAKASGARDTAKRYEVCLSTLSDGQPLPYTDKQIIKLLKLANKRTTIENIVDKYTKLCIHDTKKNEYMFLSEGDTHDNVYVGHPTGYAYVLCASVFSDCPCIFNLQGGKLEEPEYETDDNGVIVMTEDGELKLDGDDDNGTKRKEFNEKYGKHCRIIRYKDVVEQQDDLSSIFDDSCFDLHGYSKREATITAGIVQCFEGTARNIFEKPIATIQTSSQSNNNDYKAYTAEIEFLQDRIKELNNVIQDRSYENVVNGKDIPFSQSEISTALSIIKAAWFTDDSATKVEYSCSDPQKNGFYKSEYKGTTMAIYDKYVSIPTLQVSRICCAVDNDIVSKYCFSDKLDISPTTITMEDTTISVANIYAERTKLVDLLEQVKLQKEKSALAHSAEVSSVENFTLTLFDMFRNKIKVMAVIALALWVFLLGWKMINGDAGKMSVQDFGMMALKVFLCYMVVFGDEAKNYLFNLSIQTAQGVGMFLNDTLQSFRSQKDNAYNAVCNKYSNTTESSAIEKNYGTETIATRYANYSYSCEKWEKKVKEDGKYVCKEMNIVCPNDYPELYCTTYYKNKDNTDSPYCKTGYCKTSDNSSSKNYSADFTGNIRDADVSTTYDFECPILNSIKTCTRYSQDTSTCEQMSCQARTLTCPTGSTLSCSRYEYNEGVLNKNICISGSCKSDKKTFMARPPFERPYKIIQYYDTVKKEWISYRPKCHTQIATKVAYDTAETAIYSKNDPKAEKMYSTEINAYVWACPKGYKLDDGFRIDQYIDWGFIDDNNNSILLFSSLLPESYDEASDGEKIRKLKEGVVVRTAVATTDRYGIITEYDFVDDNNAAEGMLRAKYRIYLNSKLNALNKNSDYPVLKQYGLTRNYKHLSFWDSMDCKIIQYMTFQGGDSGFTSDVEKTLSATQNGNVDGALDNATNALLHFVKFLFMVFPFGILVFAVMFGIGASLFMLVARAAQQYCICTFNLVLTIYLSPFVFLLYLFDQTQGAMQSWLKDLRGNIVGACVPFVSISLFLFIIDWILFGDASKYATENLFTPSGSINVECYMKHEKDAPIACLSTRLIKKFSIWSNILSLITFRWDKIFGGETFLMAGYLILRCLFGALIIFIMTTLLDKVEEGIYNALGSKPDTKIGGGFDESAGSAIKSGLEAGKSAFSVSTGVLKATVKAPFKAIEGTVGIIGSSLSRLGEVIGSDKLKTAGEKVSNSIDKAKETISNVFERIKNKINPFSKSDKTYSQRLDRITQQENLARNQNEQNLTNRNNYINNWADNERQKAKSILDKELLQAHGNQQLEQYIKRQYNQRLQEINKTADEQIRRSTEEYTRTENAITRNTNYNKEQLENVKGLDADKIRNVKLRENVSYNYETREEVSYEYENE